MAATKVTLVAIRLTQQEMVNGPQDIQGDVVPLGVQFYLFAL